MGLAVTLGEEGEHRRKQRLLSEAGLLDYAVAMLFDSLLRERQDRRAALVEQVRGLLGELDPAAVMTETGPMQYTLSRGGEESTFYLENLLRQTEGMNAEENEAVVRFFMRALIKPTETSLPPVASQIVPTIKDQLYLDMFPNVPFARAHLAADLWIVYAVDYPDRIETLKEERVQQLGLSAASLRELAVANLLEVIPAIEQHGEGDWFLVTAGEYTASVLLVDGVWDQLAAEVEGDLVVAVPSRDVLLVTGSKSQAGVAAVRGKAIEIEQGGSYAVSSTLLRRRDGVWTSFQ